MCECLRTGSLWNPCNGQRLGSVFEHAAAAEPAGGLYLDSAAPRDGGAAGKATDQLRLGASAGLVGPGKSVAAAKPVDCWFVRVWEPEPPPGIEPLEWNLYADQPVESLEDALGVAMDYGSRFLIEEFHKGLKTGLNAESLQLETSHRLMAAIAVMSVVALRLLDLKELGRRHPEAAASGSGLDAEEREILGVAVERDLDTVAEVLLAVGRLGRPHESSPRRNAWMDHVVAGTTKLRLLVEGARLRGRSRRENRILRWQGWTSAGQQVFGNAKSPKSGVTGVKPPSTSGPRAKVSGSQNGNEGD